MRSHRQNKCKSPCHKPAHNPCPRPPTPPIPPAITPCPPVFCVPNFAAIVAFNDGGLINGSRLYVQSTLQYYVLDRSNTDAADGYFTFPASVGPGNWLLEEVANAHWTRQYVWHYNNIAGNDENDGLTPATSLRTGAAIASRLKQTDATNYLIQLHSDVPANDDFRISNLNSARLPATDVMEYTITIQGEFQTQFAGSVLLATDTDYFDASGGNPATITSATAGFAAAAAANIGQQIRVIDGVVPVMGPPRDSYATILEVVGSVVSVSQWWDLAPIVGFPAGQPATFPPPDTSFEIVHRTNFGGTFNGAGAGARTQFEFKHVNFSGIGGGPFTNLGGDLSIASGQFLLTNTRHTGNGFVSPGGGGLDTLDFGGSLRFAMNGCTIHNDFPIDPNEDPPGSGSQFNGIYVFPNRFVSASGCTFIQSRIQIEKLGRFEGNDLTFWASVLLCNSNPAFVNFAKAPFLPTNGGQIGLARTGFFNVPGTAGPLPPLPCIMLNNGALVNIRGDALDGFAGIYGKNNAGDGVKIDHGAHLFIAEGVIPNLKALGIELNVDDDVYVLGDLGRATPPLPRGAGGLVPATEPLATWADWANVATFNRRFFGYSSGTSITNSATGT